MSCSSSSGSGCSSVPAGASSAVYQRTDNKDTYKYTVKETVVYSRLAVSPFLLMLVMGIVAGLAIYINDVVSSFNSLQPVPTHQNSSQTTSPTKVL
jgi:hypothetical protein